MRAAALSEPGGGPDFFRIDAGFPDPVPEPGEALVRVTATSVNYLDLWVRRGIKGVSVPFPHVCGCDVVGEVVGGSHAGRRVLVLPGVSCGRCHACLAGHDSRCPSYQILGVHRQGGYAEYVAVPESNLFDVPETWSDAEAAAFPLVYLTAWHALAGIVGPGRDVLVLGASGGVGSAAVQVAKSWGAAVLAATSREAARPFLEGLGVDRVLVGSVEDATKAAVEGGGVDLVFDPVGGGTVVASVRALRPGGRLVTVGDTAGSEVAIDLPTLFRRELEIVGVFMGGRGEFDALLSAAQRRNLRPPVGRVLPLEAAGEAHRLIEDRSHTGKIVLQVR